MTRRLVHDDVPPENFSSILVQKGPFLFSAGEASEVFGAGIGQTRMGVWMIIFGFVFSECRTNDRDGGDGLRCLFDFVFQSREVNGEADLLRNEASRLSI